MSKKLPADGWRELSRVSGVTLSGNTTLLHSTGAVVEVGGMASKGKDMGLRADPEVVISFTPVVAADMYSIDLELSYEYNDRQTMGKGDQKSGGSVRTETKMILWDGGAVTLQLSGGERPTDRILYLTISANLIDPSGAALRRE